ncbi:DMT family transporter [Gorillibacterium sp. sgz5001074]|uniref:DMT family transporter n=1 Tax=Gorillibacterium sp. sgz5001074 TaxID=3446695 RepID=UPI003F6661D6
MKNWLQYKWISVLLILIGASSYGMLSPLIKLAFADGYHDGEISSAQTTLGTIVMWLLVLITPEARQNPFRGPWIKLGLIGMAGLSLTTVFYNKALSELDASLSIVLLFQFTWITILMECLAGKRWPTAYQTAAVVIVLIGTVMSVNLLGTELSRISPVGIAFGFASAVTYSLFLFLTGRVESKQHPFLKSAWMLTAGLVVIYCFYPPAFLFEGGTHSAGLWLWGLGLGIVGQVIPTVTFIVGIPRTGAALAAMLGAMELPVAVIGAFVILREQVTAIQWLGMLLILGGVLVSELRAVTERARAKA